VSTIATRQSDSVARCCQGCQAIRHGPLKAQNAAQEPQGEREEFSRSFIAHEDEERADALTGEIIDNINSAADALSPSGPSPDSDEHLPGSSQVARGRRRGFPQPASSPSSSISVELTEADRALFMECAAKLFRITFQDDYDGPAKRGVLASAKDQWK
jgi:hypothetical protein